MYAYRGPYMMFSIATEDDGEAKNIIERVFGEHNLYASEADSGDGSVLGVASVPIDEYYDFITDMYVSIGDRVVDCPEFAILESTAAYVVVKINPNSEEEGDQIRSAMANSGLYLEKSRTANGWDIVKFSGMSINICLLYSHYPFVKDFVWDDYDNDPIDPPPAPPAKPWVAIRIPMMGGDSGPCRRVAETICREASDRGHAYDMPDTYYTEQMDDGTGFLMPMAQWYAFRCSEPAYYDVIRSKSQTSWYEYLEVEVFEVPDGYDVFSVEYYQGYGNKNLAWIKNGVQTIASHTDSVATELRVLANGMDWTVPANIVYTISQAAADEIKTKAYEQYIDMPEEAYYRCKTILPTPNPV